MTLPVWVAAAAVAATKSLLGQDFQPILHLEVPHRKNSISVPVISAALLNGGKQALAITKCDPGKGLDLTRDLEIWVFVQWDELVKESWLKIEGGEGVGRIGAEGDISISKFAQDLIKVNLRPLVPDEQSLLLEVVFPRGRDLAERTSNESFGVVDGLALIGTQAEVQVSASPEQLKKTLEALKETCSNPSFQGEVTFVLGENGFHLANQLGLATRPLLKIGNWLGPLLVAAAESGVQRLLLFGYHGKLVKVAGGIFHTHHHLADARLEVLTALAVGEGLQLDLIRQLSQAKSIEEAFQSLEFTDSFAAKRLWKKLGGILMT